MKKLILLIPILISGCLPQEEDHFTGYMEGEYVYIAPSASGILEDIFVTKGQDIKIGDKLFSIDTLTLQANVDSAKLSLEKAQSNFADLSKGKRSEEILVILKQKDQAEAILANAEKDYKRSQELFKNGFVSKADLDAKTSSYKKAKGQVEELSATLKTAMLGAREDSLKMLQNDIDIAKQNVIKAQKIFDDSHPKARVNGKIEDVYYRLGEFVGTASPVVSILPPENIKARFFVSQKQLPRFISGKGVIIDCDGCNSDGIKAKISFVSSSAEFTPPVIYSVESREKLVFMIEATPLTFTPELHPGLPITVRLEEK